MAVFSLKSRVADLIERGLIIAVPDRRDDPSTVNGWEPKNDSAFVLPFIEAAGSKSGLITLSAGERDRPRNGVVLAIGRGLWDDEHVRLIPVQCSVGDMVTFGKYSGEVFEIQRVGDVFIMVNAEIKARCQFGSYPELVEHTVGVGTERERNVYHEPHLRCEHCPEEAPSAELEAEREKLREGFKQALAEALTTDLAAQNEALAHAHGIDLGTVPPVTGS